MYFDHAMVTPPAASLESDWKRMKMLPDVAYWIPGTAVPLNTPKRVGLNAEVPS